MVEIMPVVPGELLGTEEEFVPGRNTAVENSEIYASATGEAKVSERDKAVEVANALANAKMISKGDVVIARVEEIFEPIALLSVAPVARGKERVIPYAGYCVIHASNIRDGYVKNVRDEIRIGDIVRARVEEIKRGEEVALTMKDRELGVIKAFCILCRSGMRRKGNEVECEACGNIERRKLAEE